MKTTIIVAMMLAAALATAQDPLTRLGITVGGAAKRMPMQEATIKSLSVESPVRICITPEQFEKHCLDRAAIDADASAVYVQDSDGFRRQTGIGNHYVTVIQRISSGFFLARAGERFVAIRAVVDNLMDDQSYSLPLVETGESYTYTTVFGAGKRVAVYALRPAVTKEGVLARFIAGETFLLPLAKTTTTPCIHCGGGGFVDQKMGQGGIRKTLCPACKGKRNITLTCELIHAVSIRQPKKTQGDNL